MGEPRPTLSLVTVVNDERLFRACRSSLERQHDRGTIQWIAVDADRLGWGATRALNAGIERATADWVVCVHQDVVFPAGWWPRTRVQLESWTRPVGVAGTVGVRRRGVFRGAVRDPHGDCRWGPLPAEVLTLDEHLIVLRRSCGLRFDPGLPGFHCYGAQLCLAARARGLAVVAVDAPVLHRSPGRIDAGFDRSAEYLLRHHGNSVGRVIPTCAATIAERSLATAPRRLLVRAARRLSIRRGRRPGGTARPAACDKTEATP